jgi:hypothetical protein
MADHNDPNAVNSIFSDIDVSAADLYDIFGFPIDDSSGEEKVVSGPSSVNAIFIPILCNGRNRRNCKRTVVAAAPAN